MEKNKFLQQQCNHVYQTLINLQNNFKQTNQQRSYGGYLRSKKKILLETLVKNMIENIWIELGKNPNRLIINSQKIAIPINDQYLQKQASIQSDLRNYVRTNPDKFVYKLSVDQHVYIDNQLVMAIECKSYTENAMIKRIFVDFQFLKTVAPQIETFLVQFESQLGGDYSLLKRQNSPIFGSYSTHTIASFFPTVNLKIRTLMAGERLVNQPIHNLDFLKTIDYNALSTLYDEFRELLEQF